MRTLRFISLVTSLSLISGVSAALFPDVPNGAPFEKSIEALVEAGVIGGNPDGKFYPDRAVNRAEFLKMLYKAAGKTPNPFEGLCFPDVESQAWYASYVCDAVEKKYVSGYPDGKFRPATEVNRVEALKMIMLVFGITVTTDGPMPYTDVPGTDWYATYVSTALQAKILPVEGQSTTRLNPNWPLKRGEAAAYIYNAMNSPAADTPAQHSSSSSSRAAASSSSPSNPTYEKSFPFTHEGEFNNKQPSVFHFEVEEAQMVETEVVLENGGGNVSCRLYLIDESGFSERYYLGFEEDARCFLKTKLSEGKYQLDVKPNVVDAEYIVKTTMSNDTDRNDGFTDAKTLTPSKAHTDTLAANDLQDWYKFTVGKEANMKVEITEGVTCLIYVENDVDIFGFELPACNKEFEYPAGTYYIGIGRTKTKASTQTYTILLR